MKVLIVDHSKVFRAIWQRMVVRAGHEPMMVGNGAAGLALLERTQVDLVCVSLSLPDTDGISFARKVRQSRHRKTTPIVLLTSSEDKSIRRRAFEAGITDVHSRTKVEELFERARHFVQDRENSLSGRVLYVEDSSTVSRIMIHVMKKMNLEVDHFRSAANAWERFDPDIHDLVISDILVEGEMSGVALVSHLRERFPSKTELPILAMSGMEDENRRIELFRLGINDFISKPVIMEEARARISNLIVNKQLFDQVQEQRRQLYDMAMTDPLTGLYNRNSLSEFAGKLESAANRRNMPLSVILIDLDHFKSINDNHGHLVGDHVLREIGEMLSASCREEDFAVRFGGEELMLILPWCPFEDGIRRAEELRSKVESLKPAGTTVTCSIGVSARQPDDAANLETIINAADLAVYRAKDAGRNCVIAMSLEEALAEMKQGNDPVFHIEGNNLLSA